MLALDIGQKYLIVHRSEQQRRNRVSVMTYLGKSSTNRHAGTFNARPVAGTQEMPWSWIKSISTVNKDVPHSINTLQD